MSTNGEAERPDGRPANLVLAGAGSILAVLAFVGGMAVGHSWDGTATQQNQFGGPGGGVQRFPGQNNNNSNGNGNGQSQGNGQGPVPGQQQGQSQPGNGQGSDPGGGNGG